MIAPVYKVDLVSVPDGFTKYRLGTRLAYRPPPFLVHVQFGSLSSELANTSCRRINNYHIPFPGTVAVLCLRVLKSNLSASLCHLPSLGVPSVSNCYSRGSGGYGGNSYRSSSDNSYGGYGSGRGGSSDRE